ncbi:MAG: Uma2 family endonuclease [Eubacteriaceae bacterium]|jgi:Uma2 family endonuclease|nr:Uma2 family endonuclease [Eubacteriaceae bacterium]
MEEKMQIITSNEPEKKKTYKEVVAGKVYERQEITGLNMDILTYLYGQIDKYHLTRKPLNKIRQPYTPFPIDTEGTDTDKETVLLPQLSITEGREEQVIWVVELVDEDNPHLTYFVKPLLYAQQGVRELWIIEPKKRIVMVYHFEKDGFIPSIYQSARRIKVGIYKNFLLSHSEIFKSRSSD